MRSIEITFIKNMEKNPYWSSYICLAEAVKNKKYSRQAIHKWFNKFVEKDDYDKSDKKDILLHLEKLSNVLEEAKKSGATAS